MALFVDNFDGAINTTLGSRSGWLLSIGFYDVLKVDGAGALKSDAYTGDPKSGYHDTGSTAHYLKAVIGAGFLAGDYKVGLGISQIGKIAKFSLLYSNVSNSIRIIGRRDGGDQLVTTFAYTLAAGDEIYFEQDDAAKTLQVKVNGTTAYSEANTSYFNDAATTGVGIVLDYNGNPALSDILRSFEANSLGGGDVTAPTLTSATATATGATTATGGVTTDEAGPAWAVLTTSSTTPSAAQIKAGQNHTGAAASAGATATLVVGANPGVFSFTGLTGGGTYWEHVVQDDTATPANTSTPITSASSITTPTPDTTPPTMNGSITVGTKTSGSISISYPAASDNVAVTGYEVSTNGSTWSDNGTSLSYTFLGLSALTSYTLYVRAYDAAGNRAATPLTVTTSTYRAGDTAANILANTGPVGGNPAGFLYAFASTVSGTDWLSYTITSGPTPSGGTLTANPDGTFTYFGPEPATLVIQPEVNGVNAAETITVTLYDQSSDEVGFRSCMRYPMEPAIKGALA